MRCVAAYMRSRVMQNVLFGSVDLPFAGAGVRCGSEYVRRGAQTCYVEVLMCFTAV